jgi:hypothetical protein
MEEILARLEILEKKLAMLEKPQTNYNFKDVIKGIVVSESDIKEVLHTSMMQHIIKIINNANNSTPFLKLKRTIYKCEKDTWIKLSDEDITYMFEYIEYLLITQYKNSPNSTSADDFFDHNTIIYGLNLTKNFKKIKTLFVQSL